MSKAAGFSASRSYTVQVRRRYIVHVQYMCMTQLFSVYFGVTFTLFLYCTLQHWRYFQILAEKKKSAQAEEKEKEKEEEREKAAKEETKDMEEEKEKEKEKEGEGESSAESSAATEQREAPVFRVVPDTTTQSPSSSPSQKSGEVEADSTFAEPEEDPIVAATKRVRPGDSKLGTLEKIFSVLSIDRALSLLGAILPQELSVSTCSSACKNLM